MTDRIPRKTVSDFPGDSVQNYIFFPMERLTEIRITG